MAGLFDFAAAGPGGAFNFPNFPVGHPMGLLAGAGGGFREQYRCYSMVFSSKDSTEILHGGKIIMPPSALEKLSRLHISYPMLFKLENSRQRRHTHCGVLEFVAEEGRIYVPHWIMNQLAIKEGDIVVCQNVSLPLATFSKFQPQSVDFLDITNPKAVLESKLRSFACLTKGDIIGIEYNGKIYEMLALDTKPGDAVSIIECDMKVDFAAPVGYKEPEHEPMHTDSRREEHDGREELIREALEKESANKFQVFSGDGQRLDGKSKNLKAAEAKNVTAKRPRGIPNYNYKKGKLTFAMAKSLHTEPEEPMEEATAGFVPFAGQGLALRVKKSKRT